jgi:iron complex outermembrane receptor protein
MAISVTDALSLDAGLRGDLRYVDAFPFDRALRQVGRDKRTFAGGAAALGALYTLGEQWSVAANFGSAWRPPNVAELYSFGVHHGTATFEIGDADLSIERSADLNATVRHESAFASAEVSTYVNHIFGYVYGLELPEQTVTIRGTFPTVQTVQNDVRFAGIDADLDVHPLDWLSVGARTSLIRADNLDLDGPLYGVPTSRVGASVRLHGHRLGGLADPFAEAEVTHVSEQTRLQPGAFIAAPYPPSYTLASMRLGTSVNLSGQALRLQLGVQNLFNTRYRDALSRFRYFIDEPGRNVTFTVGLSI